MNEAYLYGAIFSVAKKMLFGDRKNADMASQYIERDRLCVTDRRKYKNVVLFNPKCDGNEALAPDPALPRRRVAVYHRLLETESRRGGVRCRADGWQ